VTYRNGCHAGRLVVTPKPCTTTNADRPRTVMIFGDSHAAHWHAAVLAAAKAQGWRMRTLTKSGCPAVAVTVRRYKTSDPYGECNLWRSRALSGLAARSFGRVDVLVISSWHFHTIVDSLSSNRTVWGEDKVSLWRTGMRKTLASVLKGVKQVVILRDSPDLPGDMLQAQACYAAYGQAAQTKCGTTLAKATSAGIWNAERQAVAELPSTLRARVKTVDLTSPTCAGGWCGPIDGPYLAFKDDNHWTQTWVKARMNKPVYTEVKAAMLRGA
jgi:hypothetical protein